MPLHHVLITFIDSPDKPRCVPSDLSEQQLQKQFVTLYRKGKDILCGSEVIRVESINVRFALERQRGRVLYRDIRTLAVTMAGDANRQDVTP